MLLSRHLGRWLAHLTQPRQPESGCIRLNRRRIYILPTRAGFLYLATLFTMLLGAINYDLALGHALVFLLAGLGLVGMLHTHRNLLGIEITGSGAEPVTAGEFAHFQLLIHNPDQRPRTSCAWSDARQTLAPLEQHLPAQHQTLLLLPIPTQGRGWLTLPPLRLSSRYPLGLFEAWANPWPQGRCLVYPRPHFTPLPIEQQTGTTGNYQGREGQEDFAGLRERQPADSPRHIAWKAVARDMGSRPLLVKIFSGGARPELWLDWEAAQGDLEQRLSQLTAWVMDAEAAGLEYGLRLPDRHWPPARGAAHQQRCLEALALYSL